jgi:two-component system chemotaxis sensor kinase CheA
MARARSRLQLRLHAGFLVVALVGLGLAAFLVDRNVERMTLSMVEERLSNQAMMLGQMTASALFGPLDESDSGLNEDIRRLGGAVHTHLSLVTPDGRVVADSDTTTPLRLPSESGAQEVVHARTTGRGTAIREGGSGLRMFVAEAIVREGKILGFARSSLSMNAVTIEVRAVRARMAWGAVTAALVAVALAFVISSRIVRPIRALTDGARRIEGGDLQTRISVPTGDEISELADAFNQMTDSLRGTIAKLDARNQDMRLVLDNVSDGLLVIDRDGTIGAERSAVVETWFGPLEPKTKLWEYLASSDRRAAQMLELGWEAVCEGVMPLALTLAQMPHRLTVRGRVCELVYEPILAQGDLVQALVVVSDVTQAVEAERVVAEQKEFVDVVERLVKDKSGLLEFVADADSLVRRLTSGAANLVETERSVHTLRGNASMCGLASLAEACRALETRMHDTGEMPTTADFAELVARWQRFSSRLSALTGGAASKSLEIDETDHAEIHRAISDGAPQAQLLKMVSDLKLEPVEKGLERLGAQAKVLGTRLGKGQVDVVVEAGRLRLDRDRWRPVWAALGHVIRNAIDHGVESPEERRALGKPECGRILLSAKQAGNTIAIEISDDGRGIDWDALTARAEVGGLTPSSREELLFAHGVSTRGTVGEYSGRGVGLGAVRAACNALGGWVEVSGARGKGTTFRIIVPAFDVALAKGPEVRS